MNEQSTTIDRPRYAVRTAIEAVKDAVGIPEYAATLTELHGAENKLRGRCPVHGGDNPQSFAVYSDEGHWHCFKCNAGGDVVDLCQAVEGGELWEAVVSLSLRFNVDLPERPPQWFEWQDEKGRRRRMIRERMANSYQRRLFRVFGEFLRDIEDPREREVEARRFYGDLRPVAVGAAENRMSR
jgi:DNA primase